MYQFPHEVMFHFWAPMSWELLLAAFLVVPQHSVPLTWPNQNIADKAKINYFRLKKEQIFLELNFNLSKVPVFWDPAPLKWQS